MRFVAINADPAEVIAGLYGIGPHLAERIVGFRQQYGFLRGPEDLARVAGISQHLALTLSPHIDWNPPISRVQSKRRKWGSAAFHSLFGMATLFAWTPFSSYVRSLYREPRVYIYAAIYQHKSHNVDPQLTEIMGAVFFGALYHLWLISMAGFFSCSAWKWW